MYTLDFVISTSTPLMSQNPREQTHVLHSNLTLCCHVSFPYIMGFDIEVNHQKFQTTRSHASRCHHYDVEFVLFHNVTFYTNSLSLRIHVNTTRLLKVTCTLVATRHDIRKFRVYHFSPHCWVDTRTILVVI